ncbi:MAG: hypothetical protein IJR88_02275 [Clostridia bacterium]|nr:hypothetical protein [Clostridia bacterium]
MFLQRSNLFLHLICPILSILFVIFVNDDHTISFKASLFAMIPVVIYSILYAILAIFIGPERGGWRDHYRFTQIHVGGAPITQKDLPKPPNYAIDLLDLTEEDKFHPAFS